MKAKIYISALYLILLLISTSVISQVVYTEKVIKPVAFTVSKNLSDLKAPLPSYIDRSWKEKVIPNKEDFLKEFQTPSTFTGSDPVLQDYTDVSRTSATIDKNFAGQINRSGVAPPDTDGDVSPDYYMQMVNLSYQIWDKNGNSLIGPFASSTLWTDLPGPWSGTNDGDPIVLYDQFADRWIASQFSLPSYPRGPFYELIAVSVTNDPTGSWYLYAYQFSNMPDYPKLGVWPDGYYMTINQFLPRSLVFAGAGVAIMNRAEMIAGNPNAPIILFNMGTSYGSILPADADGANLPVSGSPNYLANLGSNSLRIWQAHVDWINTNNSTVSLVNTLSVQQYSYSGITINQKGTSQTLDPISDRLMHRLQYRKFANYEVMMVNHTVNANGSGQAGVRWYELRKTGSSWSIYQQGTFAPADGNDRWMGSIAMNGNGDIGLGYSVSGSSMNPAIRFTGQSAANSGTGILDVNEMSIKSGNASQTGVNRWGDYSMMSVDPSNDVTFWYTNEYSTGGWNWQTQISSFNVGTAPSGSAPVANFSGAPTTILAGNNVQFTDLSTNLPTSWSWTFIGGTPTSSTAKNPLIQYNSPGTYPVSLTVTNSYGTDTKTISNYITVNDIPTDYCSSTSTSNATDWIIKTVIAGNTNTSGASLYHYFTEVPAIQLIQGAANSILLTPNTNNRKEFWRVWIDYNGDMDFADAGEQVFAANNRKGNASGSFTIPTTSITGQTRMRISMKFGGAPSYCETFTNGEVEDYNINISGAAAAPVIATKTSNLKLELYPNPVGDLLHIKITSASQTINLKVYNALGSIVKDLNVNGPEVSLDMSNFIKGIYYVGIDDGVETMLKKFIKE